MTRFDVGPLPEAALAASAEFHAQVLPRIAVALAAADSLVLAFAPADHAHAGWRRAAIHGLAREHAPRRINGIASDCESAIEAACAYLDGASGVTGQYWPLDAEGAAAA